MAEEGVDSESAKPFGATAGLSDRELTASLNRSFAPHARMFIIDQGVSAPLCGVISKLRTGSYKKGDEKEWRKRRRKRQEWGRLISDTHIDCSGGR